MHSNQKKFCKKLTYFCFYKLSVTSYNNE